MAASNRYTWAAFLAATVLLTVSVYIWISLSGMENDSNKFDRLLAILLSVVASQMFFCGILQAFRMCTLSQAGAGLCVHVTPSVREISDPHALTPLLANQWMQNPEAQEIVVEDDLGMFTD